MTTLIDQLARYAAYHRDRRNVATHCVGIPMIVLAVAIVLSRPAWSIGLLPVAISPAWPIFAGATAYYLLLDVALGITMVLVSTGCVAIGAWAAHGQTAVWLGSGMALFVIGWVFQLVGHAAFEHRKPAFFDDLIGLLIGPIFVLAEMLFGLGWRPELRKAIERQCAAIGGGDARGEHPSGAPRVPNTVSRRR
jgi:uncharacterized membrane protein YGL010W